MSDKSIIGIVAGGIGLTFLVAIVVVLKITSHKPEPAVSPVAVVAAIDQTPANKPVIVAPELPAKPQIVAPAPVSVPVVAPTPAPAVAPVAKAEPAAPSAEKFGEFTKRLGEEWKANSQKYWSDTDSAKAGSMKHTIFVTVASFDIRKSDSLLYPFVGIVVLSESHYAMSDAYNSNSLHRYTLTLAPVEGGKWKAIKIMDLTETDEASSRSHKSKAGSETELSATWADDQLSAAQK